MSVRTEQLVNYDNEHVALRFRTFAPLIRDSEYSRDKARVRSFAFPRIVLELQVDSRIKIAIGIAFESEIYHCAHKPSFTV